jgi:hypothetical protein
MSFKRIARENYSSYSYNLYDAKEIIKKYTKYNFDLIDKTFFLTFKGTKNIYEKNCYYLHFLIMFKQPSDVHNFLNEHKNEFGSYATKMFINFPLLNHSIHNIITPVICAITWSNNPELIRLLYQWGADFSLTDLNGKYFEEIQEKYYINHLNAYIGSNIFVLGMRRPSDFSAILNEVYYLVGKKQSPLNWSFPKKIIN